jgi:enediyne biosynthesis protein E4
MNSSIPQQPWLPLWRRHTARLAVIPVVLLPLLPALAQSTFTKITTGPIAEDSGYSNLGTWVDYDNDGDLDLFVANGASETWLGPAQASSLYRNEGNGTFTKITDGPVIEGVERSVSGVWGDYNNDGYLDLFVANSTLADPSKNRNSLYQNNGNGTFTKITGSPVVEDSGLHSSGAWADYDNDGRLDLLVAEWRSSRLLYHNNGDETFTRITQGAVVIDETAAYSSAWGDYDNDGDLDLFVGNLDGDAPQNSSLYRNEGHGMFTKITTGSVVDKSALHASGVWGDYDNDGDLDLDGNGNHWLKVKLVGTISNRAAIGAKVRVQASLGGAEQWQMREISTGSGYSGHNLVAHFGLGQAQEAEVVRIEWPSGIVQELRGVRANQTLTVTEPARLQVLGPGKFHIPSWKGMAFKVQASTDLKQWSAVTIVTNQTGAVEFTDAAALTLPRRFYRVAAP